MPQRPRQREAARKRDHCAQFEEAAAPRMRARRAKMTWQQSFWATHHRSQDEFAQM
jgi:hypothetical protein